MARQKHGDGGGIQWQVLLPPDQREYIDYCFQRIYERAPLPGQLNFDAVYDELAATHQRKLDALPQDATASRSSRPATRWGGRPRSRGLADQGSAATTPLPFRLGATRMDSHAMSARLAAARPSAARTPYREEPARVLVAPPRLRAADKSKVKRLKSSRERWSGVFLLRTLRRQ